MITAYAKLEPIEDEIDLEFLSEKITNYLEINPICKYQISSGHKSKKKNEVSIITSVVNKVMSKGSSGLFYNCVELKLKDILTSEKIISNVSIKFFKNHTIHISGLRDSNNMIINLIENMTNHRIINFKYALIRSKTSLGTEIHLNGLQDKINNDPFFNYCTYNPSHYPGLNVRCDIGSVSIFGSGSVLVSTKRFEDIDALISKIYSLVRVS
jgi:hypothetical protein